MNGEKYLVFPDMGINYVASPKTLHLKSVDENRPENIFIFHREAS